jgi:hypothetical protein
MREQHMKLKIGAALMLLITAAMPLTGAGARSPAETVLAVTYDFYIGGLKAGEMTVAAVFGREDYQATAEFRTTGIIGFFADTELQARTLGRVESHGLTPVRFTSIERKKGNEQFVEISFSKGGPPSLQAAPEFRSKPWSIKAGDQRGTTDPLSAILTALAPASANTVCNRRIEAFDGKHRFAFAIGSPVRVGENIRCEGAYIRLAGFKPEKMRERGRQPLTLNWKQRADGLFQVVRLISEGEYGAVVMRVRD